MRYCYRGIWISIFKITPSFKTRKLGFIQVHVETNVFCCLLQVIQHRFGLGWWILKKCKAIHVVCNCRSFCEISLASCLLVKYLCLLLDLLIFVVWNLDRLWIDRGPMYLLARLQQQCRSNQCRHQSTEVSYMTTPIGLDFRITFIYMSLFKKLLCRLKVIIDNIHYINFITFGIRTVFFFSWLALLKVGCVLYIPASYMPSNAVVQKRT